MSKKRGTSYGTHAGDLNRDLRTPNGEVKVVEHEDKGVNRCASCKAEIRLEQRGTRWVKVNSDGSIHPKRCQR